MLTNRIYNNIYQITDLRSQVLWISYHHIMSEFKRFYSKIGWSQFILRFTRGSAFHAWNLTVEKEILCSFGILAAVAEKVQWISKITTKFMFMLVA